MHPKLADLGLMKNLDSLSRLTRSNLGLGTMQFVSPEQFDDARTADPRSDVYSLAATMYVMLTGENPFGKGATMQVVTRKMKNEFDGPGAKVAELSPSVDKAIVDAIQADPQSRPQSVAEFVAEMTAGARSPDPRPATAAKPPAPLRNRKKAKKNGWPRATMWNSRRIFGLLTAVASGLPGSATSRPWEPGCTPNDDSNPAP